MEISLIARSNPVCFILGISFLFVFVGCSPGDSEEILHEKWELVRMTAGLNPPLTGSDMAWQESYVFYGTGDFLKHMERNGQILDESGTYSRTQINGNDFIKLEFASESEIISNCTAAFEELLWIISDEELWNIWYECDGPKLEYILQK